MRAVGEAQLTTFVMAGLSPSKTGVNALMPGHPRLPLTQVEIVNRDQRSRLL
jgi:hypothetical protein